MRTASNMVMPPAFAALIVSLLALSPIAFHSKSPLVFFRFDGTYLLICAAMEKTWGGGRIEIRQQSLAGARRLRAVLDANLAGYSVTKVLHADSAQDVIASAAALAFDPRSTAVLTVSEQPPPLVPVSGSNLTIERGGYRVEADSPGVSLLVLPIEYSHCLRPNLTTSSAMAPRLFRVNLAMTGILLSGRVEGHLSLRYGLLSSECRMQDWRDAIGAASR